MTTRKINKAKNGYTDEQVRWAYSSWQAMKNRCNNPNQPSWERYGGRGIAYDLAWESFEAFFEDMGGRTSKEHTLDRIDNNGDYTKSNCRWVKRRKQNRNTSQNIVVVFKGCDFKVADLYYENAQVSHLVYKNQIPYKVFGHRVIRLGWDVLRAAKVKVNGTKLSIRIRRLAKHYGLPYSTVKARLQAGWGIRDALRKPKGYSIAMLAREHGLTGDLVTRRLRSGWSLTKALTTPNKYEKSLAAQARERGLSPATVQVRVRKGWSVEKALSTPLDTSKIRSKK